MERIGFIGLGVMGKQMAGHLLDAGYPLNMYNRTASKADDLVARGATVYKSPKEVAQSSDIIITIVGYPEDVEEVYFGQEGIFEGLRPDSLVIDMTTSRPSLAQRIAGQATELECQALDAPVSGGDIGARNGSLTTMVGGSQEAYDRARPVLQHFSQAVYLTGPAGSGQHTKMANQIMIAGTMTGMAESLAYGKSAGLDLDQVIEVLSGGAASNWSLANYGPRILAGDYSPGFFVKHFVKDLGIALEEADRLGLDLPGTQLAYQLYNQLSRAGESEAGTQAIIKHYWPEDQESERKQ